MGGSRFRGSRALLLSLESFRSGDGTDTEGGRSLLFCQQVNRKIASSVPFAFPKELTPTQPEPTSSHSSNSAKLSIPPHTSRSAWSSTITCNFLFASACLLPDLATGETALLVFGVERSHLFRGLQPGNEHKNTPSRLGFVAVIVLQKSNYEV